MSAWSTWSSWWASSRWSASWRSPLWSSRPVSRLGRAVAATAAAGEQDDRDDDGGDRERAEQTAAPIPPLPLSWAGCSWAGGHAAGGARSAGSAGRRGSGDAARRVALGGLGGCGRLGGRARPAGISGSGPDASGASSRPVTRAQARSGGRRREPFAGVVGDARRQLPEQVVGDQRPPLGGIGSGGPSASNAVSARSRTAGAVDREQLGDLVVTASSLQHQLEDGALVARAGCRARPSRAKRRQADRGARCRATVGCRGEWQARLRCRASGDARPRLRPPLRARAHRAHRGARARPRGRHRRAQAACRLVHGGVYAAIAETLASPAPRLGVIGDGKLASGCQTRRASCGRSPRARSRRAPCAATRGARPGSGRSRSADARAAVRAHPGDDRRQASATADHRPTVSSRRPEPRPRMNSVS